MFFFRYNKLSREVREVAEKIAQLDNSDPYKAEATATFLQKLHGLGLTPTKVDLEEASRVSASSFCRRRLPVVMVRRKYIFLSYFNL